MKYRSVSIIVGCMLAGVAEAQVAKNAILFIGDGMGPAQVTAARIYQGNARDGKLTLDTMPYTAIVRTYAADFMVTDSAASATALATGVKTNNFKIGQGPAGEDLDTILELAKKAGRSVGLVTTTTITHATPACFYGNLASRAGEAELAAQLIAYGEVDVIMGGGREFFIPQTATDPENGGESERRDDRDLFAEAKEKGYRVIHKLEEFDALREEVEKGEQQGKVLALFSPGMMSYELTRKDDAWGEPDIASMTQLAIDMLKRNPNGYFFDGRRRADRSRFTR